MPPGMTKKPHSLQSVKTEINILLAINGEDSDGETMRFAWSRFGGFLLHRSAQTDLEGMFLYSFCVGLGVTIRV
jgi:hypothetical protein